MANIPNIYTGNYKKLMLLPLVVILISCYFIPHISLGVDFKGGVLLSIQTNSTVSDAGISSSLAGAGFRESSVRVSPNPLGGSVLEVEIPLSDEQIGIEEAKLGFDAKIVQLQNLKGDESSYAAQVAKGNATDDIKQKLNDTSAQVIAKRNEVNALADKLLPYIGKNASQIPAIADLSESFSQAYSEATKAYKAKILSTIAKNAQFSDANVSFKIVSPALSKAFIEKATNVVIASAILTAIVVFFVFRSFIPSIAVLTGATSDVIIAMGAMGLFGIPLTLPSFAALLMLIGFSLDTDVLLTMRVLKRTEGTARERAYDSMLTGITMSLAALTAFATLFILSLFTNIPTYNQISAVAICGLFGDIAATWCFNAVMVLWYTERKQQHGELQKPGVKFRY
ncbi:Protein-export membrane protein SecF [Candidatus Gugararchaeum adminiculabundum]|nr:Protein-export membrane protein SecF [Candidatus Gugararchaeum adminiculabundum]